LEQSLQGLGSCSRIQYIKVLKRKKVIWQEYLLTYSKEKSPSWEANQFSASQEIPRSWCNPRVHCHIHKCLQPVPILCRINPVHVTKYTSQEKVSEIQTWQCSVLTKTHEPVLLKQDIHTAVLVLGPTACLASFSFSVPQYATSLNTGFNTF